jgi:hypothetical protein
LQHQQGKYTVLIQDLIDRGEERLLVNIDDLRDYDGNLAKRYSGHLPFGQTDAHKTMYRTFLRTAGGIRLAYGLARPFRSVLDEPVEVLPFFHKAVQEIVKSINKDYANAHPVCCVPGARRASHPIRRHGTAGQCIACAVLFSLSHAVVLCAQDLQVGLDGNFGLHHVTPRGLRADLLNKIVCLEGIITKCMCRTTVSRGAAWRHVQMNGWHVLQAGRCGRRL